MRGTCVCLLCMKRDAQRTQNSQFGKGALWKKGVGSDGSVLPLPSQKSGICGFWLFVLETIWVYVSRDKEGYRRGATTLISSP